MHTTSTWPSPESFHKLIETVSIIEFLDRQSSHFPTSENPGSHEVVSQGNFHAEVLALVADAMSLACLNYPR